MVFLARSISASSIAGYFNIVCIMHCESGLESPTAGWDISLVKKGILRTHGKPLNQKLPITPDILRKLFEVLDMECGLHKAFWCACLIAFQAFLRKSSLLPKSGSQSDRMKALTIGDVVLSSDGNSMLLNIRHSKTIQFRQRVLSIPISAVPNSSLCAVEALTTLLASLHKGIPSLPSSQPLFSYLDSSGTAVIFLNHDTFVSLLKGFLNKCGLQGSSYSGHSFRRGGCSYAFSLGIPAHLVKLRGDWKSNAYERYLTITDSQHLVFSKVFSSSLNTSNM